jgi:MFS family permease
MPIWPLVATLAVQTLATMAVFSLPAAAPEVARDLGVDGGLVGLFVSMIYGVSIASAMFSPGFIHRYGAVRVSQVILVSAAAMLAITSGGTLVCLGLGALAIGVGYGATAPAATHLLVPQTPPRIFNMVMSIRQIGVPLGGILGALLVPPLVLAFGWRWAMGVQAIPALVLALLLQIPRRRWDAGSDPAWRIGGRSLLNPLRLLGEDAAIRRLSVASFVYSGIQLSFIAFMTVHLTSEAGFDLVGAGRALAVYQIFGAVSRPVFGWIADKYISPRHMLGLQGLVMAGAALAAGAFGPHWPVWLILVVCGIAGATASGYTGLAFAEYARLGGPRRTEATGLGAAVMFAGVMLIPSTMGFTLTATGNYMLCFTVLAALATVAGVIVGLPLSRSR